MRPVHLQSPSTLYTQLVEQMLGFHLSSQIKAAPCVVIIGHHLNTLENWAQDILFFQKNYFRQTPHTIHLLSVLEDAHTSSKHFDHYCDTLTALTALKNTELLAPIVLLTTPQALLQKLPTPEQLSAQELKIHTGQTLDFKAFTQELTHRLGYDHEALCEAPGQFSVRGGLVDIYPLNASTPYRIDFFGSEIESIRTFDPTTQRSQDSVPELIVAGSQEMLQSRPTTYIWDYLPASIHWIFHEPHKLELNFPEYFQHPEYIASNIVTFQNLLDQRARCNDHWLGLQSLDTSSDFFKHAHIIPTQYETLASYRSFIPTSSIGIERFTLEQSARAHFLKTILDLDTQGFDIHIVVCNEGEKERLYEILKDNACLQLRYTLHLGQLSRGFILKEDKRCVFVTSGEIFGRTKQPVLPHKRRKLREKTQVDQLLDFSELAHGDYLVHINHGVCIYRGLQKMDVRGHMEELISVEFDNQLTLHVRLHEAHLLSRYVGLSKVSPKLGRIGTSTWEKTRQAAEKATLDLAGELLHVQAERDQTQGHAFGQDTHWQQEFESSFIHKETPDQLLAIQATKADMESQKPMDRLICGDVGFGKTEVAIRAAFKAAMDGKQVAVLVPTTVLAQQHFNTFKERMAEYPIVVELLCRFRTPKQQQAICQQLVAGEIDIIVGTHSLLSAKVQFKNLGLLIIDEEHRFGVRQKETIKHMRKLVDVLSMSATPIPRTLHMALVGARDLSVIETPPSNRLPIQTIVQHYDPSLVQKAIAFELERNGQVFYLHNKIETIYEVAARIQTMFPDIRIGVGHGQMEEKELETVMTAFVQGQFEVLVCTTIIESGLDIPNANTIIIEGADRFGLAQLYQIRGRVGRFHQQAYAYLLLHRHTQLLDEAHKRLMALKNYNQLGAGFKIAMRDLELRGAGNILGAQQSGHIVGVGFDLYCQLLKQSIARIKGEPTASFIRAYVRLDFVTIGELADAPSVPDSNKHFPSIEASIPRHYIEETRLRIDFYRRLATAENLEAIQKIQQELIDRFGPYPQPTQTLLTITEIRCLAQDQGIMAVETDADRLLCTWAHPTKREFLKLGNYFPRLTKTEPSLRLKEIKDFIQFIVPATYAKKR